MNKKQREKLDSLISEKKSGWLDKAKWREENETWLDISFAIAVKILGALRENKRSDTFPRTQKELAKAMDCSPQYVNKVLKGAENLQLETIFNIGTILNIELIKVPELSEVKEEANKTKSGQTQDLISSVQKRRATFAKSSSAKPKSTKTTTFEYKGVSYSALMSKFNFEEEFDDDPDSPLKIVA